MANDQKEMEIEMDSKALFKEELGKVHGPVKTQFGFHLLEVLSRED